MAMGWMPMAHPEVGLCILCLLLTPFQLLSPSCVTPPAKAAQAETQHQSCQTSKSLEALVPPVPLPGSP